MSDSLLVNEVIKIERLCNVNDRVINIFWEFCGIRIGRDRLCGLVVRVSGR
jgi:hypothetical protein